jgi:hypothetical protein
LNLEPVATTVRVPVRFLKHCSIVKKSKKLNDLDASEPAADYKPKDFYKLQKLVRDVFQHLQTYKHLVGGSMDIAYTRMTSGIPTFLNEIYNFFEGFKDTNLRLGVFYSGGLGEFPSTSTKHV